MDKKVRIDKWLWAARFFKTRALAGQAVAGGHVHLNGERVKPARPINPGDELRVSKGHELFVVIVAALNDRRGPASLARTLYDETAASVEARAVDREQRRLLTATGVTAPPRKPGKRDRRLIRRFIRDDDE